MMDQAGELVRIKAEVDAKIQKVQDKGEKMAEIDELKSRLSEIQNKRKEDQEIKKLRKQIKAEEFVQSRSGKMLMPLARFGERITRPKPKVKGSPQKKRKVPSVEEIMARLPQ